MTNYAASATYEQLEAELRYVTWQRDRLAEGMRAISEKWATSPNADYRSKGEAISDLVSAILGGAR